MLHNKVGKALSYGVVKDSRTEQQTDLLRTIEREIASLKRQFTPNNQLALLTTISANDASSEEAMSPLSTALKVLAIALTVLSAALSNNLTSRPLDMLSRLWLLRRSEVSRRAIEDVSSGFNMLETSISADGCLLSIVPNSEQGQNVPLSKEPHKADDSVDALRPRNHEAAKIDHVSPDYDVQAIRCENGFWLLLNKRQAYKPGDGPTLFLCWLGSRILPIPEMMRFVISRL